LTASHKFSAVAVILLISSANMSAADAKGWYQYCCSSREFHFTRFSGRAKGEELRVRLEVGGMGAGFPLDSLPDTWWGQTGSGSVTGWRCNSAGKCEEAVKADIQVHKVTRRHVLWKYFPEHAAGKYVIDLNSRHLEGEFAVKERRRRPPCICE
jgi:hypothetical protein